MMFRKFSEETPELGLWIYVYCPKDRIAIGHNKTIDNAVIYLAKVTKSFNGEVKARNYANNVRCIWTDDDSYLNDPLDSEYMIAWANYIHLGLIDD